MLRSYINTNTPIPGEIEEGNIEYKQRLDQKDKNKIRKMASQMLWRLQEGFNNTGKSEAHYFLGIKDNGEIAEVNEKTIDDSIQILNEVCSRCQAEILSIDKISVVNEIFIAEVIVCKRAQGNFIKESRVCFLGLSGHGKTTLISHITFDQLDNGNGLARSLVLKHTHEQNSGLTSSIKHDIIGIKNKKILNYKTGVHSNWENIVLNSEKIIALTDLPGKNKFYKTTLYGLLSLKPHFNIIVISPSECQIDDDYVINLEIINNIKICIMAEIPFIIIFSKCDIIEPDYCFLEKIINIINKFTDFRKLYHFNGQIQNNNLFDIPYICISNINNNNFDDLLKLMDIYSDKFNNKNFKEKKIEAVEFLIHDTYIIPDRGNIIYGIMNKGQINVSENYYIGPFDKVFYPVSIRTIHKKQIDSKTIYEDETASIEIKTSNKIELFKDLMIVNNYNEIILSDSMEILLLEDDNIIKIGSQYSLFYDNIIEPIIIESKDTHKNFVKVHFSKRQIKPIKKNTLCILKETFNNYLVLGKII